MKHVLVVWGAITVGSFVCTACLSDLEPEVGKLNTPKSETADPERGTRDGSSGDGDGTGPSGSGSHGTNTDGSEASDAAVEARGDAGADEEQPDAGAPVVDNGCAIKDSDPKHDVSFANDLWPTVFSGCRCHNPESSDPFAILESGLTIESYDSLRKGGDNTGANVIVAHNPCESIILQKLSEDPPFGDRMPLEGPYLSVEVRTMISDWIAEGARDN